MPLPPPGYPPARRAARAAPGAERPAPTPPHTRPPAPRLTGPWPAPGGAAGREAALLQPVMLNPGAAPPGLPKAPGSRRQLRLALPGDRPTRAEVSEKEARASAGRTDRHTGQWEVGIWCGAWLRPSPAPRLGSSGRHLPAPGSWVLTVVRWRAPVPVRPRRQEERCASREQGGTRFHEDAKGGLCRPPARHSGWAGSRRPPQGVHARRRCAQARRVVCGYQIS